ncbi:sulfotransferase [Psychrobium sp. 1_MG-2023]|uniref:sulfotransferase n=1 Tax=Psychrobium sp. 1_MG-2023 TaxID=3062624 RepID=UPI000C34EA52|nr:sulfotransferase [Psychrobium sp. 1_MG-2023]MDP2562109.1 sulfotransferase [Psychrobium sp. 1_MG-2023]PKF55708.1 hypothetical protein CW748_12705 [Alteromonadales bacterium alter-6D02]
MNELELISTFKSLASGIEVEKTNKNNIPTTYIVGCPRSGTTALLQHLSESGAFAYPTNCLTRFSSSMELATVIQELLFNQDFGLVQENNIIDYVSDYGRSNGALNTNEFFHFYRRFFPNLDIKHLEKAELECVDCDALSQQIDVITTFYNKPFINKGLMMQYNIDYFNSQLKDSIFLYIKRNELYVMQSIYKARIKERGSENCWWSAKPKEYASLIDMDVFSQIAGQVYYTNRAIEEALSKLPQESKLEIKYEDFVSSPQSIFTRLKNKYSENNYQLNINLTVESVSQIKNGNVEQLDVGILKNLQKAYDKFVENDRSK